MTTLIFATATDASPLITLIAYPSEVRQYLTECSWSWRGSTPSLAAILFLRGLSPDQFDDWAPSTESVPIMEVADAVDWAVEEGCRVLVVWNPETWTEAESEPPQDEADRGAAGAHGVVDRLTRWAGVSDEAIMTIIKAATVDRAKRKDVSMRVAADDTLYAAQEVFGMPTSRMPKLATLEKLAETRTEVEQRAPEPTVETPEQGLEQRLAAFEAMPVGFAP